VSRSGDTLQGPTELQNGITPIEKRVQVNNIINYDAGAEHLAVELLNAERIPSSHVD
jgi:hypothetical protein